MRWARWLAVVAAAGTVALVPVARSADADPTITAVGWWTRSPLAGAPEGGIAVSSAPDGPVTVAAVSLDLGEGGVTAAALEAVEVGGVAQSLATAMVCATPPGWAPAAGAPLEQAPHPACEAGSVPFTRNEASSTWRADLGALLLGKTGAVAVMVVPAPGGAPLYEVRLARPTLAAVPAPVVAPSAPQAVAEVPAAAPPRVLPAFSASDGAPGAAALPEVVAGALPDMPPGPETDAAALDAPDDESGEEADPGTLVTPVPATGLALNGPQGSLAQHPSRAGRALLFTLVAAAVGLLGGVTRRLARGPAVRSR